MRHSSIFKSRWFALLWAAGILWFAYDVAGQPSEPESAANGASTVTDATGAQVTPQQEEELKKALDSLG